MSKMKEFICEVEDLRDEGLSPKFIAMELDAPIEMVLQALEFLQEEAEAFA